MRNIQQYIELSRYACYLIVQNADPRKRIVALVSSNIVITSSSPRTNRYWDMLSTADREIDLHIKQLDQLKKQKKVLMQLLLTGIVRVNAQEVP
ncbi:MAG: hypothetical protein ACYDG2_26285 [Ruminiclostridium sp.]